MSNENKNENENDIIWVVEEESRHGIDTYVFKYRPDITDYIQKKETPTEDAEWEDKYYGSDVYIGYDEPDGWEYTVGDNDYCWKCSKDYIISNTASK